MNKIVHSDNAPKPVGPYSQAVKAGKFLFVSGQLAIDPKEGKIVALGITEQTRQVMENIKAILNSAGFSLKDVVQTNVYLSSIALFAEFNVEYAKHFSENYPARVTVASALMPNALVEISVIVYKD